MNKFIVTVVYQNGEIEVVTYTRDTMAEAHAAASSFFSDAASITIEEDQHTEETCRRLNAAKEFIATHFKGMF